MMMMIPPSSSDIRAGATAGGSLSEQERELQRAAGIERAANRAAICRYGCSIESLRDGALVRALLEEAATRRRLWERRQRHQGQQQHTPRRSA